MISTSSQHLSTQARVIIRIMLAFLAVAISSCVLLAANLNATTAKKTDFQLWRESVDTFISDQKLKNKAQDKVFQALADNLKTPFDK